MIGPDVTERLPEPTLAQKRDLTVTELVCNAHARPGIPRPIMPRVTGPPIAGDASYDEAAQS
jgi:hypothetical protein